MHVAGMKRDAVPQDNEPMIFKRLGLAAERLLVRLEKQVVVRRNDHAGGADSGHEDDPERKREVV